MKKIGIAGGIGSGKSIISEVLKTMGYPVFNSDDEAKLLMVKNPEVVQKIKSIFGDEAYNGKELNKPFLAKKIFNNLDLKSELNKIVHPAVRKAFVDWAEIQSSSLVFNEAAILFETGAYKSFDFTVLVTAPEKVRIERVVSRDNSTETEVKQRMKNQWKDDIKIEMASFVILNDNSTLVTPQVMEMTSLFNKAI
ncbi:dephospho-CoA kinase [Brumimicrobium mesophilum]|uniref:dephospho-CoA kinase n=1 Tax=Brumimicrobium mesophilum TaxID=392717 RepID=UPI00131E1F35|nr:dephospho-CoA kinase [Brumimicrobium mesophilum]